MKCPTCGKDVAAENEVDVAFWGECLECAMKSLKKPRPGQTGDAPSAADRQYHGGQ